MKAKYSNIAVFALTCNTAYNNHKISKRRTKLLSMFVTPLMIKQFPPHASPKPFFLPNLILNKCLLS